MRTRRCTGGVFVHLEMNSERLRLPAVFCPAAGTDAPAAHATSDDVRDQHSRVSRFTDDVVESREGGVTAFGSGRG